MLLKSNSTKLELQLQLLPKSKIMRGKTGDIAIHYAQREPNGFGWTGIFYPALRGQRT